MRHLFTISLVFFTLAQIAQVERIENLRLYNAEQTLNQQAEGLSINKKEAGQLQSAPVLLTSKQLSAAVISGLSAFAKTQTQELAAAAFKGFAPNPHNKGP